MSTTFLYCALVIQLYTYFS